MARIERGHKHTKPLSLSRSAMVGPEGGAIGIDMTPAMIERARANARSGGYPNVEFTSPYRQHPASGCFGRLRDIELRRESRARQARRLP